MKEQPESFKDDFNSVHFLVFLWTKRKILIAVFVISALGAILFSSPWFITPKYKSTVVMFPTSTNAISKALMSEAPGAKQDILEFGEEEQAEQLLQILNSSEIRSRIVKKYDLMKHYNIDSTSKYKNTKLYKEYEGNIKFRRTEYMAVEISVMDKDPQMAADIANDIAALLDSVKNNMQKQRAYQGFKIVEAEYLKLVKEVQQAEDSLTKLREYGVHDYETQAEMINQQLAIEIAKGNTRGIKALEDKLAMLAKYGGPYVSLRDQLEHEKKQLSQIKAKYEEAKVDAQEFIPQKFIVESAYKAEKKSYPVRWLILVVSVVSSLILAVIILIVMESLKQINFSNSSQDRKE